MTQLKAIQAAHGKGFATVPQLMVFLCVAEGGEPSITAIARTTKLKIDTTRKIIGHLEQDLKLVRSTFTGRMRISKLSRSGIALLKRMSTAKVAP